MTSREFSEAARLVIEQVIHDMQDDLASKYAGVIRKFAQQAARNYTVLTAGARPDELIDPEDVRKESTKAVDKLRRHAVERVIGETLAVAGVAFDVAPLLVDSLTAQIGVRSRDLNRSMLRTLVSTIDRASAEGWTVPETAAAIEANVTGIAPGTSTMLARTDLIGLANGGSIVAAREVLPEGATKTWRSASDDKVRPDHEEADGQSVPLAAAFEVGGESLDYPGDPSGSDENVCNCRCVCTYDEAPVEPITAAASPDVSDLAMIAVYPTDAQASSIAVDGGMPPETLHVTMVFLGKVDDIDMDAVGRSVEKVAADTGKLEGRVGGVGLFAAGPDGSPQLAIPNVKGLAELRTRLTDALADEGVESPSEHDWVPHMTLAYVDEPELPDVSVIGEALTFAALSVAVADVRTDYDLREPVTASATREATMKGEATIELSAGAPEIRVPVLMNGEPTGEFVTVGDHFAVTTNASAVTAATVTLEVPDDAIAEDVEESEPLAWVSDLAFEGVATVDGRWIVPGGLSWRQPPLTLLAQTETAPGHDGAGVSGKIETFMKDDKVDMDGGKLADGVVAVRGFGVFDAGEFGVDIERMVNDEVLRGVSVDLGINEWAFRDPDTGDILVPEDMTEEEWERAFFGELQFAILDAEIMAATVCAAPAFADSRIAVVASAGVDGARLYTATLFAPLRLAVRGPVITASAAGMAPLHPPREWFDNPELVEPTALTVTDDGRVFGHVETFQCHIGRPDACVPPPSNCSFDLFHVGMLKCDDGTEVAVGQLTMDTDHASIQSDVAASIRHYDNTGLAIADVRVGYDGFGTWMAGALRPDVDAVKVRAFKAAKVSGDWRPTRMGHELVAVLVVNSGGFPVPRPQALVASCADGTQETLAIIAAGIVGVEDSPDPLSGEDTQAIRLRVLAARAEGGMSGLAGIVG